MIAFTGKIKVPVSACPTDHENNIARLSQARFVTANCACTKKALKKIGGFDEHFTTAWREDSDLEFKFIKHQIPVHPIAATVIHPVRKASWGVSLREQKKVMFNALLFKKYPSLYREKIQPAPAWNYYIMVCSFFIFLFSILNLHVYPAIISGCCWLILLTGFIHKRLANTSHNFSHVIEMIITSAIIPFLSVYWTLYGAWKFKVLYF